MSSVTTVTAAVTVSKRTIEYQQKPAPESAPGFAVIHLSSVTLCGTDAHIWDDDYATELPIIQGHEAAGIITELHDDDADSGWAVGDRVAILPMFSCGECYACSVDRPNACRHMSVYGCYEDGSLVTQQAVPLANLFRLPDTLPLNVAALAEPVSIAMQACVRGQAKAGEKVLVSGAGPIGVLAAVYLKDIGCDVTLTDTQPGRLQLATRFGADRTMQVQGTFPNEEQRAQLDHLTAGDGPSLVIDATGAPASVASAIDVVATAGRVVCVGISDQELTFQMRQLPVKEIDVLGSRNSRYLFDACLELLDRQQDVLSTLITHRFPFDQLDRAFHTLIDPTAGVGKIAIDFPEVTP